MSPDSLPQSKTQPTAPTDPLVRPFRGIRPAPGRAAEVAAPPYDVLSTEEARAKAFNKPWSFLRISKAEIEFPPGFDPYAEEVYTQAAQNFHNMLLAGVLVREAKPCYYAYRLAAQDHVQTGVVVAASVAGYEAGRIRRHELTRPDKEDDRVRQIETVDAQTGPALLAHRPIAALKAVLAEATAQPSMGAFIADDGVGHALWVIDRPEWIAAIDRGFAEAETLYIADGHHRTAAAARVAGARRAANPHHRGDESYSRFLAVAFASDEMRILDYNRVVRDLAGMTPELFLTRLETEFVIERDVMAVRPERPRTFGMYLSGTWYRLSLRRPVDPAAAPADRLDVSLLADRLLGPLLGISDPRRDRRIDFVGGVRGLKELEKRVNSDEMAVAFALYPTSLDDLFSVADAGAIMPPKSTWFEPKLADGLISYPLD